MLELHTINACQLAMTNLIVQSLHIELTLSNKSNGLQTHETVWMNRKTLRKLKKPDSLLK